MIAIGAAVRCIGTNTVVKQCVSEKGPLIAGAPGATTPGTERAGSTDCTKDAVVDGEHSASADIPDKHPRRADGANSGAVNHKHV
jgi:hypothetical protein